MAETQAPKYECGSAAPAAASPPSLDLDDAGPGDLLEEILPENAYLNHDLNYNVWDHVLYGKAAGQPNLQLLLNTSCVDTQTSGQIESAGGIGKTTAEMQTAKTFETWGTCDNKGVWTIDEGNDYPRLWWENQPGEPIQLPRLSDLLLGTGTVDDPFLIYTPDELNMIGLYACEWNKHFKLMANIDLSGFDGIDGRPTFNLIAPETPFTGVFDGNGYEVQHLTVNRGLEYLHRSARHLHLVLPNRR